MTIQKSCDIILTNTKHFEGDGMIKYYKLLDKLNRMEMSKEEFRIKTGVSSATIAKLSKNEYISLKAVDTFCKVLNCQPGDLLEYVPDDV